MLLRCRNSVLVCCCVTVILCRCVAAALCRPRACETPPFFTFSKAKLCGFGCEFLVFPALCQNQRFLPARAPPPLIFPFSFFEFSRSACAPLKGTPRTHFAKIQKRKRKRFGATKLWPCLLSLFSCAAVASAPPPCAARCHSVLMPEITFYNFFDDFVAKSY